MVVMITLATPSRQQSEAATSSTNQPAVSTQRSSNKFARRWHAYLTYSTGERVDEGIINITDVNPPSADYVKVVHPSYGGPYLGLTASDSDRIEVHILLGDGRVGHYDMHMASPDRAEGRFFITGGKTSSQSLGRGLRLVDDPPMGTWGSDGGG
jgi:hypothetical protein